MSRFDRFMVANAIGTNRKLRRLPVVQRWVYVAGVLALASQSPLRGALLITDDEPATAEDIAQEATVKVSEARAALASFRKLGMLTADENGVEWVHDWDSMNPAPKPSDAPAESRKRKREQRDRERGVTRDNGVTSRAGHAMSRREVEVEGEGKAPPAPQGEIPPVRPSGNRKTDIDAFNAEMDAWAGRHFPTSPPVAVAGAVAWLRPRTSEPVTAELVRAFAASNETWAAQLGLPTTGSEAA